MTPDAERTVSPPRSAAGPVAAGPVAAGPVVRAIPINPTTPTVRVRW